ncbi:Spy0128 family protein [Hugonella massiliensis]|uniref:Spy0128 family protein n=1 Tax=Hugonella massiliensis TaxID=1720315 RepID=UPI00073F24C5|nr:FctA domain-containing protein [Hugonella massiliensis]
MVDMSNVPVGYTVKNSVGGNTTKTTKYGGGLVLTAKKTIDGNGTPKDGQFAFQLVSDNDTAIQTKRCDGTGAITFDEISYSISDVGKTFTYQVKEAPGDDASYTYDSSVYTVTVTPQLETDSDGNPTGIIIATPSISKAGTAVDGMAFDNTSNTGSLRLTKTSTGHETPASAEFAISGPGGWSRTVTYGELQGGSITLDGLPVGTYTVKESGADVAGWTLSVGGDATAEVTKGGTAEVSLENAYTQDTGSLRLTKTSTQSTSNSASTVETPSSSSSVPETGDSVGMASWPLALIAASAAGALLLASRRRNKGGDKNARSAASSKS